MWQVTLCTSGIGYPFRAIIHTLYDGTDQICWSRATYRDNQNVKSVSSRWGRREAAIAAETSRPPRRNAGRLICWYKAAADAAVVDEDVLLYSRCVWTVHCGSDDVSATTVCHSTTHNDRHRASAVCAAPCIIGATTSRKYCFPLPSSLFLFLFLSLSLSFLFLPRGGTP